MTKFVKNNMDTIQNISSLLKNLSLNSNIDMNKLKNNLQTSDIFDLSEIEKQLTQISFQNIGTERKQSSLLNHFQVGKKRTREQSMFKRPVKRTKRLNQEPVWKYTHHWECPKNQQIVKYTPLDEIWKIFDQLKKTNGHPKEQKSSGSISKNNLNITNNIPYLEKYNDIDNEIYLDEQLNNETKDYDENAELDGYPTDIEDDDDLDYSDQEEIDSL
jgi:hypothetical protein